MVVKNFSPARLSSLRLRRGYTQDDLAHELRKRGMRTSAKQISRWESGAHAPGSSAVAQIAAVFQVTIDELYGDEDDEESRSVRVRRIRAELVLHGRDDLAADLLRLTGNEDE